MTSSNDNEHKLNEVKADLRTLLDELHLRLGATEAIMDNYLGKTEGDFVKMAASGTVSAPEDIVSKLDELFVVRIFGTIRYLNAASI